MIWKLKLTNVAEIKLKKKKACNKLKAKHANRGNVGKFGVAVCCIQQGCVDDWCVLKGVWTWPLHTFSTAWSVLVPCVSTLRWHPEL
jgi:hypothetical protein